PAAAQLEIAPPPWARAGAQLALPEEDAPHLTDEVSRVSEGAGEAKDRTHAFAGDKGRGTSSRAGACAAHVPVRRVGGVKLADDLVVEIEQRVRKGRVRCRGQGLHGLRRPQNRSVALVRAFEALEPLDVHGGRPRSAITEGLDLEGVIRFFPGTPESL